ERTARERGTTTAWERTSGGSFSKRNARFYRPGRDADKRAAAEGQGCARVTLGLHMRTARRDLLLFVTLASLLLGIPEADAASRTRRRTARPKRSTSARRAPRVPQPAVVLVA